MSVLNWSRVGEMAAQEVKVKALLYGDSGAGKTHAASTAPHPRAFPVLCQPRKARNCWSSCIRTGN